MKKDRKNQILIVALMLVSFLIANNVSAQDEQPAAQIASESAPAMDEKAAAMMKKFQEFSTPNENHKALDFLTGEWTHTLKWWMGPTAAPEESTGTSEVLWAFGGRFLKHKVSGTSMGQPFEGLGITGFNNIKKVYETIWLDNISTGIMKGTATFNAESKTMTEEGSFSCPMTDGDRSYRATTTFKDNDNYTYEMYMSDPESGVEFKSMEIVYTRKK